PQKVSGIVSLNQHQLIGIYASPGQRRGIRCVGRVQPENGLSLPGDLLHKREYQVQLANATAVQQAFTQGTLGPAEPTKLVIQNLIPRVLRRRGVFLGLMTLPDTGVLKQVVE